MTNRARLLLPVAQAGDEQMLVAIVGLGAAVGFRRRSVGGRRV